MDPHIIQKNNHYLGLINKALDRLKGKFNSTKKIKDIEDALSKISTLVKESDITKHENMQKALARHRIGFFGKAEAFHNVETKMKEFEKSKPPKM